MFSGPIEGDFIVYGKIAVPGQNLKWDENWILVRGYWLEISKKNFLPPIYSIPLDLLVFKSGFHETTVQNSIKIVTTINTGNVKLFLSTTNRLDIINLYKAIKTGSEKLRTHIEQKFFMNSIHFVVEMSSGFLSLIKTKADLNITSEALEVTPEKGAKQIFSIDSIVSMSAHQNTDTCGTHLVVVIDDDINFSTKEFIVSDHNNLINAISCFLFNIQERKNQTNIFGESPLI